MTVQHVSTTEHARQQVAQHLIAHVQLDILDRSVKVCMEYIFNYKDDFWHFGSDVTSYYRDCLKQMQTTWCEQDKHHEQPYRERIHKV